MCPVCPNKTRIRILPATVLENFPLFYPRRKQKTLANIK
ncbi:MAG: cysteine-rich KTR domain-containing protein [Eubacteriales bacterium]